MKSIENLHYVQSYGSNQDPGIKNSATQGQLAKQKSEVISFEIQRIRKFASRIKGLQLQILNNKKQCQRTIFELKSQLVHQNRKISDNQLFAKQLSVEESLKSSIQNNQSLYVNLCKKRIQIANQVNLKTLRKIQIQDKESPAHEIFKWIMICLYCQSDNKYFWPNFKQQAFENDKGKDFIERLGKFNSIVTKQEQKLKTEKLLQSYGEISKSPELHNALSSVNKIHQVVILFQRLYTLSEQIKQKQRLIQKNRQLTLEKDEQLMKCRARSQALQDRILVNESYLKLLKQTEKNMIMKERVYQLKIEGGEKFLASLVLGANKQNEANKNLIKPCEYFEEKKNDCECTLF